MPRASRIDASQDVHFPKAGVDRSAGFGKQPARPIGGGEYARTCHAAANVRAFDARSDRLRGGARPGLSKYVAGRPGNALWLTQMLNYVTTSGNGLVQQSNSGRLVTLVAVSQGNVYTLNAGDTAWGTPTNNAGVTPPLNVSGVMQSSPNNQKLYIVDGTNYVYYDPHTASVERWAASAGALPVDDEGNKARLIATWRGRTVLSGLLRDPQNWFMSRVSDPTDFDYGPQSPAPDDPVAGNNSPLGFIGDVVTGLAPINDDVMIFFGDHTTYRMAGDPLAGGQIDLLSDVIGAAWGKAWCRDPYGNIYWLSNRCGLYRMEATGGMPMRISQPVESLLQSIDTGASVVTMLWDDVHQGCHLFVTTAAAATAGDAHYFFDARVGGWFPQSFGNASHNPVCGVAFDGNLPTDRKVLIGSWDGYVRQVDASAADDDGTAISSSVLIGPVLTPTGDDMMLHDIQGVLAETSGAVTWEVLVGSTAEAALASTAVASGTWGAGRNLTDAVRYAGHAVYIRLSSVVPWAMEFIRARISTHGKVRRRGA